MNARALYRIRLWMLVPPLPVVFLGLLALGTAVAFVLASAMGSGRGVGSAITVAVGAAAGATLRIAFRRASDRQSAGYLSVGEYRRARVALLLGRLPDDAETTKAAQRLLPALRRRLRRDRVGGTIVLFLIAVSLSALAVLQHAVGPSIVAAASLLDAPITLWSSNRRLRMLDRFEEELASIDAPLVLTVGMSRSP